MAGTIDPSFPKDNAINIRMNGDVKETQYYSLADIMQGDSCGTTDTDSKTDTRYGSNSGYTNIYGGGY